jgi:hypothetical protein
VSRFYLGINIETQIERDRKISLMSHYSYSTMFAPVTGTFSTKEIRQSRSEVPTVMPNTIFHLSKRVARIDLHLIDF